MAKVQISENDIRRMVSESVKKILNEEKSYPYDVDLISDMRNDFQWKLQQFKQEIENWMKRDGYDIYFDEEFFKKISKACSTIFDEYILKKE